MCNAEKCLHDIYDYLVIDYIRNLNLESDYKRTLWSFICEVEHKAEKYGIELDDTELRTAMQNSAKEA